MMINTSFPNQRSVTLQRLRDSALDVLQFALLTIVTTGAMPGGVFLLLFCDLS